MTSSQAYQAALDKAVCYFQPQTGFLQLSGVDRTDFLQRQTTNDLRQLAPDRTVMTVLTSPTARVLDVLCLMEAGEALMAITLPERHAETEKFLRSRIFFSDQVAIANESHELGQILLVGPEATDVLENLDIQPPEPDHLAEAKLGLIPATVIAQKMLFGFGFLLIVSRQSIDEALSIFSEAGIPSLDPQTYEILRIEAGQPGPQGELVADFTPLEVRLDDLISDSKGCYTGQEIIARQITYEKVNKKLVGLKLNETVEAGATIEVDGKSVGIVTSAAESPRWGSIALGVVRRPFHETGRVLSILGERASILQADVIDLPFH